MSQTICCLRAITMHSTSVLSCTQHSEHLHISLTVLCLHQLICLFLNATQCDAAYPLAEAGSFRGNFGVWCSSKARLDDQW